MPPLGPRSIARARGDVNLTPEAGRPFTGLDRRFDEGGAHRQYGGVFERLAEV